MPPTEGRDAGRLPRWKAALYLLGGWSFLGLVYVAQQDLAAVTQGRPYGLGDAFRMMASWWTWLPFLPVVWWAALRFPLGRATWLRNGAVHVLCWAAVILLMSVPYLLVWTSVGHLIGAEVPPTREAYTRLLVGSFASDLLVYVGVVAAAHATVARREAGERAHALERAEAERAQTAALLARAELEALRAHLNPHFLFNTLHTINALVQAEPARAEWAIERFGDLLRYVLRLDRERVEAVRLADEVAFVRAYLALEQLRLGERLRVEVAVDDEALDVLVPPFTLQPLVENAIRHGIAPRRRGGTLGIAADVFDAGDDEALALRVWDDGLGADAAAPETAPEAGGGIGLRAVCQRLHAAFGDAAAFSVQTAPGAGFAVHMRVPVRVEARPVLVPLHLARPEPVPARPEPALAGLRHVGRA